jgi:hypothetical protein
MKNRYFNDYIAFSMLTPRVFASKVEEVSDAFANNDKEKLMSLLINDREYRVIIGYFTFSESNVEFRGSCYSDLRRAIELMEIVEK